MLVAVAGPSKLKRENYFRMNREGELTCCAVCNLKSPLRCARCLNVYYCNTEHQRQDWRRHKSECVPKSPEINSSNETRKVSQRQTVKGEDRKPDNIDGIKQKTANEASESETRRSQKPTTKSREEVKEGSAESNTKLNSSENVQSAKKVSGQNDSSVISRVVYTNKDLTGESAITYEGSSEQEILNETAQLLTTVEFGAGGSSNVLKAVNRTDKMPVLPAYGSEPPSRVKEYPEASLKGSAAPFNHSPNSYYMDPSDPCYKLCQQVISDMTQYGVCVLNNFLGKERGQLVLNEVLEMYRSGIFSKGQLVSNPASTEAQTIRSDLITWIDGKESHCYYIRQLISQVDNIILRANKMANNGKLGDYIINGRTKAMVACYPGSGSHYVKHVDNPNKDGRCITAIYYLNLDWDVKRCGGLLRVFPEGTNQVADIEPIFDRMLFFWSDRRNPHEVQPAYSTRNLRARFQGYGFPALLESLLKAIRGAVSDRRRGDDVVLPPFDPETSNDNVADSWSHITTEHTHSWADRTLVDSLPDVDLNVICSGDRVFMPRYAITLWYFDAQERSDALRNFKGQRVKPSSSK